MWLIHMLFGPIEYPQLTAPQMDQRVRRRHQAEISELLTLGFDYLCSEGQRFPFTRMLRLFPALVAFDAWIQRTPIWIKDGAITFGYPILVYRPNPTFVELDASNAEFVSAFEDGAVLVTGNYENPMPEPPGVMRRFKPGTLARHGTPIWDAFEHLSLLEKRLIPAKTTTRTVRPRPRTAPRGKFHQQP